MTDTTSPTDAPSPTVQLVRTAYSGFNRGDIDSVVEAMHPDIEWHEAEHSPWHRPGGHHGPQEVMGDVFARLAEEFEHFDVDPQTFHDAGSTVVVEGRYRGTPRGIDPSSIDTTLDAQFCHVWTIRHGTLAGFQQYTDTWQFARVTSQPQAGSEAGVLHR